MRKILFMAVFAIVAMTFNICSANDYDDNHKHTNGYKQTDSEGRRVLYVLCQACGRIHSQSNSTSQASLRRRAQDNSRENASVHSSGKGGSQRGILVPLDKASDDFPLAIVRRHCTDCLRYQGVDNPVRYRPHDSG